MKYPSPRLQLMMCGAFIALLQLANNSVAQCDTGNPSEADLIAGEVRAVAYSGFREGQHPDRGNGAVNPSDAQILEDLQILVAHDFHLIRLYDSGENSSATIRLIEANHLPIHVVLGAWLDAEISNHEGCPWLMEPISEEKLTANRLKNDAEVAQAIVLANAHPDVVVAINVGNEALVSWNDHLMPVDRVIELVRQVKEQTSVWVTVAENFDWWVHHGQALAAELDFVAVHTYPAWEGKPIEEALAFTEENIKSVQAALPGKRIAILEAGWATTAAEFTDRAGEAPQKQYFDELMQWAADHHVSTFFFEAFDEPWKGSPDNPDGAEKHWGIFFENRSPKTVMR